MVTSCTVAQDTLSYFQMIVTPKSEHDCQLHGTGRFKISSSHAVQLNAQCSLQLTVNDLDHAYLVAFQSPPPFGQCSRCPFSLPQ
jgi:hypothetical protein